jgi:tryptophanyl-tRNA synthetase
LIDSPEEIRKKINLALTDSNPGISYDPVNRPGVSNLVQLLCHFEDGERSCDDIVEEHQNLSMQAFKKLLAKQISDKIEPIRERYLELRNNKTKYLEIAAEKGAESARVNANHTLHLVKEAAGLY